MTLPIRPDLTFGSTPALSGALTGRLPFGGPPPAPYTPEGWEEERKRRLQEAIALGLPIRDVKQMQLPEVKIEAPRPALPQLANVLAREMYPELEGTTPTPTSPLERYSVGGVLADVAAQPIAALMSTSGRIGEGIQRTLGFEEAARRTKERTQALNEALAPTTGLGVAARVPAELLTSAAPYVAAGPGAAGLLRSAALTGIESRAEEGSTVKALADLTESETLRRIAQSPYKTAADIGLDLALNAAPEVIGGALRGTRTAARAAEPGFLPAASAVARQVGQNIADVRPGAAVRALGTAVRQDPISALTAAATLGSEAVAPGLGTLAAAIPATTRAPFADRLFSRLGRAIEAAPFEKGTPQQWAAALAKNVAAGEREFTGIDEFLRSSQAKTLTKAEVRQAFEQNRIRLGESVASPETWMARKEAEDVVARADTALNNRIEEVANQLAEENGSYARLIEQAQEMRNARNMPEAEKFERMARTLMSTYRDEARQLLSETGEMDQLNYAVRQASEAAGKIPRPTYGRYTQPGKLDNYREVVLTLEGQEVGQAPYRSSHWSIDNPLLHVRMSDRTLPDGQKVLFVEEMQSDWHQAGRKQGYRPEAMWQRRIDALNADYEKAVAAGNQDEMFRLTDEFNAVTDARREARENLDVVPDAPFKKTSEWTELALKRVIDEAVQGGYDRVVLVTGEQAADNFDLSRQISRLDWNTPDGGKTFRLTGNGGELANDVPLAKLPDYVGKEIADKIATASVEQRRGVLQGVDLKVGGEGMRSFYDKLVPSTLRDLGKSMGLKFEFEPVNLIEGRGQNLSFRIAPEARERIMGEGMRLYDIGGATGEALRQIVQRPALATGVGAAVGAAQSPEDRLGGAAVGALAGAGIAGAVVSGKQLLKARRALIEAGLPTELDRAYALAKGSIDFTGQVGRQIAQRGREGFKRVFEKAIDGLAEIDRLSARAEARGMAPERSAATGLNMALSSQATAARALREGVGVEQGGIIDPETLEIVAPSLERVFQPLGNSPIKNEQGMTYAVALRRLGRYERAVADLADWETRAASGAGRVGQRPVSTVTMPSGAKRATRLKDLIGSAGETIPTTSGLGDRPNPLQVYGGDEAMLEADRAIVEAFGQKPEFVEFANGLRQYTDGLANYAVKTGLWTPEMAQRFKDSDALYVPFKRLIEANTAKPKMGMRGRPMPGQVTPGVQRFKGSDLMIGNPAEALAEYTASLIRRADAYRVGTMLMDTVEALGEEGAGILTKIDATDARVKAAAVANAEAAYRGMGLPEDEAEALADVFARLSTKNEVIWRNTPNGKEYFLVNDPALLNALSTLNVQDEGAVKAIVAVFGPLKRLATAFATGYAPAFWLGTNLPRDVQMGLLQTSGIRPGDVAGGMAEALKSIFGRSTEVEALGRAGAGQVSQYGGTLSPAAVARQIAPTTGGEQALGTLQQYIGAPLAAMERVGRASELPMRLAAARAARRQGAQAGATEAGQRALAARQFAQATVDFRRRSGYALDRMFEQTVPYYGAAKKGLGMFLRTAARNPKRVGAAVGLVGLAVAMEDVLLGEGQERVEALDRPSYERAKYLRVGNTKVALPQELAVFASAFRVGLAQLRQDDPYVYEQFKQSLENLLPPVVSDVARGRYLPFPVLGQLEEIAQNRSVFTGRPIVPQGMERRMPSERRYETTAPTFDVLAGAARALGAEEASPLQAEYLVRGLTGRFTPAITAVTDIPAQAIMGEEARPQVPQPVMRQPLNPLAAFRVQPTRATESEREYYDLRSAYQQARATVTALDRQYEQAQAAGDEDAIRRLEARSGELQQDPLFAQASRDVAAGAGASDVLNWEKQVQDRMDDIQADIDYVESEYAAKRMTGERARKLIDEYNTERRSLMREAAAGLRSKMGTPR